MSTSSKKAALITLGCKVNQYESEAIAEKLAEYGFIISEASKICDVYIINTCTVTAESERKCRQMIRRAIKTNPNAYILVCGCLSQTDPESIKAINGVDYICGNTNKLSVADVALELIRKGKKSAKAVENIGDVLACPFESMNIKHFDRTRAYVKIQDGCESRCTYCIIPSARGHIRSKAFDDVLDEIKVLTEGGCREVVLTGIETGSYGKETGKYDLADLLMAIDGIEGINRVRTGSLDPAIMKRGFIDRLAQVHSLSPHFHLSMQSGSDRILALMKRRYNAKMALEAIEYLREKIDDVMFTTDIITGFPGESDEDFEKTKEFLKKARFLAVHVFPYSERENTPAANMPNKVPVNVRHERCNELIEYQKQISYSVIDDYINTHDSVSVLFETYEDGLAIGHTPSFVEVAVRSDVPLHSRIFDVKPIERRGTLCFGEIIKERNSEL